MTEMTNCPESVLDAIPWYPAGLGEDERGAVEAHAADCQACRAEIGFVLGSEAPVSELPDAERIFERVMARIDAGEEASPPVVIPAATGSRVGRPLAIAASLMVAALAGYGASSGYGLPWIGGDGPVYETASASSPAPEVVALAGPLIDVVFRPEATAAEIRSELSALGASIVAGPSDAGVYRVRLLAGSDLGAALSRIEGAGGGIAILAQPGMD